MLYDLRIMNHDGVWMTDTTSGSLTRLQERGKTLIPWVAAIELLASDGTRRYLDDPR